MSPIFTTLFIVLSILVETRTVFASADLLQLNCSSGSQPTATCSVMNFPGTTFTMALPACMDMGDDMGKQLAKQCAEKMVQKMESQFYTNSQNILEIQIEYSEAGGVTHRNFLIAVEGADHNALSPAAPGMADASSSGAVPSPAPTTTPIPELPPNPEIAGPLPKGETEIFK